MNTWLGASGRAIMQLVDPMLLGLWPLVCVPARLDAVAVFWIVWARRVLPLLFAAPTGPSAVSPAD